MPFAWDICFIFFFLNKNRVGKTALLHRLVNKEFLNQNKRTIGSDFLVKDFMVDDFLVMLQLWDSSGQRRFNSLCTQFYRGSDACVLVYDVNDAKTFDNLDFWLNEFLINACPRDPDHFPIFVIGNKVDIEGIRAVPSERLEQWCHKNGDLPFFEVSVKDDINLEDAFQMIARKTLQYFLATQPEPVDFPRIHPTPEIEHPEPKNHVDPSPFPKNIATFDNDSSFPDLTFYSKGMEKSLHLHRSTLAQASSEIEGLLNGNSSSCAIFNKKDMSIEWKVPENCDPVRYSKILMKVLRFCYGEDLTVEPDEVVFAKIISVQLKLKGVVPEEEFYSELRRELVSLASEDVKTTVAMFWDYLMINGENPVFVESVAKAVLTLDNLKNHCDVVVDGFLMKLPQKYLDQVEYGEAHSQFSEFTIRLRYLRFNQCRLSLEDKKNVMQSCDMSKLNCEELNALDDLGIFTHDEMKAFWNAALKSRDEELLRRA